MYAALRRTQGLVNLAIMKYAFVVFTTKIQCAEVSLSNSTTILYVYSHLILTHETRSNIAKCGVLHRPLCHFILFYANLPLLSVSSLHNSYASNDPKQQSHYLIFIQKQKQFLENQNREDSIQKHFISFYFIRWNKKQHWSLFIIISLNSSLRFWILSIWLNLQRCSRVRNTILKIPTENRTIPLQTC